MLMIYIILIPVAVVYTISPPKPEEPSCGKNASYIECPSACPSTCKSPNEGNCDKECKPKGCHCNPSYLLSKPKGHCILPGDCPGGNPCPQNETFVSCNIRCPNSYCPIDDSLAILICDPARPCPSGCSCKPNYKRKSVKDSRCILASECPPVKCTRPNEEWNPCTTSCSKENCYDLKAKDTACKPFGCNPRCACKEGYYRNDSGVCVLASECFPKETCDVPKECRRTCAEPNPENCPYQTATENVKGCKCKAGFILSDKDGECIEVEKCPQQYGCNNDPNAVVTSCPPPCPATCQSPRDAPCKKMCLDIGCKCKDGLILSKLNGLCIKPEKCPGGNPCGKNATFSSCSNRCPYNYCPKDDSPPNYDCSPPSPCPAGCICNLNHRRKSQQDDQCILSSECPPVNCTRPNEVWAPCPSDCLAESCEDAGKEQPICNTLVLNCQPKCVCKPNTYRDKNNVCVPVDQCQQTTCGGNATYVSCASVCPPTCETPEPEFCVAQCKPNVNCQCKPSYVLSPKGDCILPKDCPAAKPPPPIKCGVNEEYSKCKITCPPQFCNISYTDYVCPNDTKCEPGCNCIKDYLRDFEGKCVLNENCPPPPPTCDGNATLVDCGTACPPTCQTPKPEICTDQCIVNSCQCKPSYILSKKNGECILPEDCPAPPPVVCGVNEVATVCKTRCPTDSCDSDSKQGICIPGPCRRGCNCKKNYARDSNGKCIPKEQCPKKPTTCGGNATYTDCASSCPPTCGTPKPEACIALCKPNVTCQCKPSYVLSPNGDCILPEDCPAPPPVVCGENEVATVCKTRCPTDSCDSDSKQDICIPGPCRRGCNCKENYARDSNGKCIPKEQCPEKPIICGGNATLVDCATTCPPTCQTPKPKACTRQCSLNRCQCKPSYILSKPNGECILPKDCPVPPKTCDITDECKATCAEPNPRNCSNQPATENIESCKCKPGFVLSDKIGECIRIEECPTELGCNGDINAFITKCPPPCPSTCESPNELPCKKSCLPVGCKCKEGFILSKLNGICIKPDNCTGGNPCKNGLFSSCNNKCPYNYCPVDDSPPNYNCSAPSPCPSGCICRFNHRKKSVKDDQCILASDCPPVKCTRPNEVWDSCPSACLREGCEDAGKETSVCNTLILNCQPRCVCKPNTYRDKNNVCVPVKQCPTPAIVCGENEVETCKFDNGCDAKLSVCKPTCDCKKNYSRNSKGKCVPDKTPPSTKKRPFFATLYYF